MTSDSLSNCQDRTADQRHHAQLLEEALKQPGVRELTEVYQVSLRYDAAANLYRKASLPKVRATLSDSSTTTL